MRPNDLRHLRTCCARHWRLVCVCVLPVLVAGCGQRAQDPSLLLGQWRAASGAVWVFEEDGKCSINGREGHWEEREGVVQVTGAGYDAPQRIRWRVTDRGQTLTLTRLERSGKDGPSLMLDKRTPSPGPGG